MLCCAISGVRFKLISSLERLPGCASCESISMNVRVSQVAKIGSSSRMTEPVSTELQYRIHYTSVTIVKKSS